MSFDDTYEARSTVNTIILSSLQVLTVLVPIGRIAL